MSRRKSTSASRRGRAGRRTLAVAVLLVAPSVLGAGSALAAPSLNCNSVFAGATPRNPIIKTADKDTVALGDSVTYTISWTSTGVDSTRVMDCFRVDDGDPVLDALVAGFNLDETVASEEDGAAQSLSFTLTLTPAGTGLTVEQLALLGEHDLVNRAKVTHGSQESRSDLVAVSMVTPPETCGDGIDNDFDGLTDEDCIVIGDDPVDPPAGDDDDVVEPTPGDDDDVVEPTPGDDDDVVPGDDIDPGLGDDDVVEPTPGDDDDVVPGDDIDPGLGDDDDVDPPAADDDDVVDPPAGDDDDVELSDPVSDPDPVDDAVDPAAEPTDDSGAPDTTVEDRVLGRVATRALATTGAEAVVIAWLGVVFLVGGAMIRFLRFAPLRATFAGHGAVAAEVLRYGITIELSARRLWRRRL